MKRKFLVALAFILTFSGGLAVSAAVKAINGTFEGNPIVKLVYNNKEVKPDDIPAYNYKGRTMVPIGFLRQLGVDIAWDPKTYSATIKMPTRTVPVLIKSQLDELAKSVYLVYGSTDDPNKVKQGSGFIINGTFITNYHVAGKSKDIAVQIDGKWQKPSKITFANETVDIMGLAVTGGKSLPVSTELPQVGDIVYSISYPGGKLAIEEGTVYRVDKDEIVTTVKTEPGSSGGMLLSGKGEVIGVNKLGTDSGRFTWSIPIKYVQDELN